MKTQDEEGIKQSEDFYKMGNYEDKIHSLNGTVPGQTQAISQAVQKTLENNGGVGIMTGSYDQNLSILSVNNLLLHIVRDIHPILSWNRQKAH